MFDNPYLKVIKSTGPHGDATCWYQIEVPKDWTMRDFVQYVCHDYAVEHQECGTIACGRGGYNDKIIEYSGRGWRGGKASLYTGEQYFTPKDKSEQLENSIALYNKYIDRKIIGVQANGGWGAMDYFLNFEPEPKSYANYEF